MYSLESNLIGQPVMSLQTGQIVAWIGPPVLDIATLEVIAFTCRLPHGHEPLLVMASDVRQYASDCVIIDDEDELTNPEDIVRLNSEHRRYSPLGTQVIADTGRRLGIVEDYSINLDTSRVQHLHVRQPLWRGLFNSNLIIDRTQIIDITPERITVRDSTVTDTVLSPDRVPEIRP